MDTARQVLRFSIPGSIFLLNGIGCYLLYRRMQGVPFVVSSGLLKENVNALTIVLATIPIGFVIYQIYYFTYEPVLRFWPMPWGGRFVRRDRGGQILRSLDKEQLKYIERIFGCTLEARQEPHTIVKSKDPITNLMHVTGILEIDGPLKELSEKKDRQIAYEELWYANWYVLRSTVDIAGSTTKSDQVKSEYTSLSDIYHSLGAARTAAVSSWIFVGIVALTHPGRISSQPFASIIGLLVTAVLTAGLYLVLHVARGRTWQSAAASLSLGLRWMHWRHGDDLSRPGVVTIANEISSEPADD